MIPGFSPHSHHHRIRPQVQDLLRPGPQQHGGPRQHRLPERLHGEILALLDFSAMPKPSGGAANTEPEKYKSEKASRGGADGMEETAAPAGGIRIRIRAPVEHGAALNVSSDLFLVACVLLL